MSKLKHCPFCGGEAIKSAFSWGNITDEYTIQCSVCGVRTSVLKSEDVINVWNTRTPMANIVEKLEEREKYLENAMKESNENGHRFSEEKAMNERVAIRYAINIIKQEIINELG